MLHVHSVQWNAGMGNTDTLHPNSCFCSFSIPTSEIFRIKFLLLVNYSKPINIVLVCVSRRVVFEVGIGVVCKPMCDTSEE